jgi:hypothetical protein
MECAMENKGYRNEKKTEQPLRLPRCNTKILLHILFINLCVDVLYDNFTVTLRSRPGEPSDRWGVTRSSRDTGFPPCWQMT